MNPSPTPNRPSALESWQEVVHWKQRSIRFGSILLTIHDGRVTQVETTEKTRVDDPLPAGEISRKP